MGGQVRRHYGAGGGRHGTWRGLLFCCGVGCLIGAGGLGISQGILDKMGSGELI